MVEIKYQIWKNLVIGLPDAIQLTIIKTYLLNEIQDILVVNKFYVTPIYFLFAIFLLLHFEYMLENVEEGKKIKK